MSDFDPILSVYASDLPGEPDGLERIWAPYRMPYLLGENRPPDTDAGPQCPFCRVPTGSDAQGLIVARGETVFAVLNLYPYATGHVMVCPYRHVAWYTELTDAETTEVGVFTKRAMGVLQTVSSCQGFNIGLNQGAVAGAGISGHLHQHIVPRWGNDANFMPIIAGVRVMPALLHQTRELMASTWQRVG